ncbi:hypothetical protein J6590_013296 [Homalodisca vitripennis]|nr:hypothetical protein J6590_013296 [Homalodisca vitripennis]
MTDVYTAEHTTLDCEKWDQLRRPYLVELGILTSGNIITKMIESQDQWDMVAEMVERIMRQKKMEKGHQ